MSAFPRLHRAAMLSFVCVLSALALRADTLTLANGDRLTGSAVKLEGGKLTFKTAWADAITVDWAQVTRLETDKPLVLPINGKNLSVTRVERTSAGLVVTTDQGPSNLDAAQIAVLRSPADQKAFIPAGLMHGPEP